MKKTLFPICFAVFAAACSNEKEARKVPRMPEWLLGTWTSQFPDSSIFAESWTKTNDSLFDGQGMGTKGKDTLFSEKLQLMRRSDTIFYVPTVSDQNQGKEVLFRFTKNDSTGFVAENPAHDFPQKIEYKISKDSIYAILTGSEHGKERKEVFPMKKK